MITTLSNISFIIVILLLFKCEYYWAALFTLIGYFFDCLDGYLARSYNMGSVFGAYYDGVSDLCKFIAIFTSLYIINPNKFCKLIPIYIPILILFFINSGYQDIYFNKEKQSIYFNLLCPAPSDYSEEFIESMLKKTRLFGSGTNWLFIIMVIIYYNYD
jgi:phosphatidylserine synthase